MFASSAVKKAAIAALGALIVAPLAAPLATEVQASPTAFADPSFQKVWARSDKPVDDRMAIRSWTWGPEGFFTGYEAYMQGPGGQRLVQYFDKSRMEINDPAGDREAQWFVTNGLLVVDMISGRFQMGDNQFQPAAPANIPVAGDTAASVNAPTYAALAKVASLNNDHRAPNRTGQNIREGLGRTGNVGVVDSLAGYAKYGVYEATLGHNIPDVFWQFLNSRGVVYEGGRYVNGTVVDWLFAMGYPITEPYWIQISVSGQERWVLTQAFQRRILTYSPFNPEGWKVEMANVGRAYFDWRYSGQVINNPTPTPTPRPSAAAITLSPNSGDTNTVIVVDGKNFPAGAAVIVGAEKTSANYFRTLGNAGVKSNGTFQAKVKLPADAARLGELTITATANSGAVRATAPFRLAYSPFVSVDQREIISGGALRVQGEGFPANTGLQIGALVGDDLQVLARGKTDGSGSFDMTVGIGDRPAGSVFKVVAIADGGFKATAETPVTVLAQPSLQVIPDNGPVGVTVTLRGTRWPAFRAIMLGTRSADSRVEAWQTGQVTTDGAGNFTAQVPVSRDYNGKSEIRLIAYESVSTYRMEASYRVTAPAPPTPRPGASVQVVPNVLAVGQIATVSGNNWPASAIVQVGVGRPGQGVEEWIGAARATGGGSFSMQISLSNRWQNVGQLMLVAQVEGGVSAATPISVVGSPGVITPQGLPMAVNTYAPRNGPAVVRLNGNGWGPREVVHIYVVSADGTINIRVGQAISNDQGVWSASFNAAAPWAGRPDLGVRASTLDGLHYSLRYLPVASFAKVGGTSNVYNFTGFNWPRNARLEVAVNLDDEGKGEASTIHAITIDGNGSFNFNIELPRLPNSSKNDVELRVNGQPYSATFDF